LANEESKDTVRDFLLLLLLLVKSLLKEWFIAVMGVYSLSDYVGNE
jgi:hypothetical protein